MWILDTVYMLCKYLTAHASLSFGFGNFLEVFVKYFLSMVFCPESADTDPVIYGKHTLDDWHEGVFQPITWADN